MTTKEEEFLKRLQATFKIEAEEHIKNILSSTLNLENTKDLNQQEELIEVLFREAHSLKGAARSVNNYDIEKICASIETVFKGLKTHKIHLSGKLFDKLHRASDFLNNLLLFSGDQLESAKGQTFLICQELTTLEMTAPVQPIEIQTFSEEVPQYEETTFSEELSRDIKVTIESQQTPVPPIYQNHIEERSSLAETIRISNPKLNSLLFQAEEMLSIKLTGEQRYSEIKDLIGAFSKWKKAWLKIKPEIQSRLNSDKEDDKINQFLIWNIQAVTSLESEINDLAERYNHDNKLSTEKIEDLLYEVRNVLMLPFSILLEGFPKLVRDLAHDEQKEVELVIKGDGIEIDKRLLEELKAPLNHIIRNCIDHGFEDPDERERMNKPRRGILRIIVTQAEGNRVAIQISDDGKGIDLEAIKNKSIQLGLISQGEADSMTEQEACSLMFKSEVSTSRVLTDISGRGLGLAIVLEKVEALGGQISVETNLHTGTSFRIILPSTLATFRGVLVDVARQLFVIPTANVERVLRIKPEDIKTVENKQTIPFNGNTLPLATLEDLLDLPLRLKNNEPSKLVSLLILQKGSHRLACRVDHILSEQEVMVKKLNQQLVRVRNIAGATVLGSGKVAPILYVPDLLKSFLAGGISYGSKEKVSEDTVVEKKSILVVEDSITSRMLLVNILESGGYEVQSAVDGLDALRALKEKTYDLVVSDVNMPRMDGFILTSTIRCDPKLAHLPVVLVTALKSREDREHGMDVGANAYMIKDTFNPKKLLETIKRLG